MTTARQSTPPSVPKTELGPQKPARRAAAAARPFAFAELPAPETGRWVPRRKAAVVSAVRDGLISLEEACQRYALSAEEFRSWQHRFDAEGVTGLRVRPRPSPLPAGGKRS